MVTVKPKKLVCIFAHPDDEAFGPGGSIAHFSSICPVHLICVTDGDPKGKSGADKIRAHELTESCKLLEVKSITFLGFQDGTLNNNNYHIVASAIRDHLDRLQPDTVMTFDPNGVSGHLDHIAVSMITSYLFDRLAYLKTLMYYCEGSYIGEALKDYFVYVPPGYQDHDIDFKLDVTGVLDTKINAMRKHVSQKADCDWLLHAFKDHLNTELFRLKVKNI